MNKHVVRLSEDQRVQLRRRIRSGKDTARSLARARVLLKVDADGPGWRDQRISTALEVSVRLVEEVRRRFCQQGLEATLRRKPQPPRPLKRRIDGVAEAKLVTLACSTPPCGRDRWTLDLLADQMVKLNYVSQVSGDTVGRVLKKTS